MNEFIIGEDFSGARYDRYCSKILKDLPDSAVQKMIRTGKIKLNSKKSKPQTRLAEGDLVTFYTDIVQRTAVYKDYDLDIIYEDERILAVAKPAGILSHPDGRKSNSLSEMAEAYLAETSGAADRTFSSAVITRLDFNTSGIAVAAKSRTAARELSELSKKKRIEKKYLALAAGKFEKTVHAVNSYHKDAELNMVTVGEPSGEDSDMESIFTPVTAGSECSLICAELITGRPHQIRAQLLSLGHPVIGDSKYFSPLSRKISSECSAERQFLHCWYVRIPDIPDDIVITCMPGEDLMKILNYFGMQPDFDKLAKMTEI